MLNVKKSPNYCVSGYLENSSLLCINLIMRGNYKNIFVSEEKLESLHKYSTHKTSPALT